jgi:hypothetical protein
VALFWSDNKRIPSIFPCKQGIRGEGLALDCVLRHCHCPKTDGLAEKVTLDVIMLATVSARIRKIGIRKGLGATQREIRFQFLSEAF